MLQYVLVGCYNLLDTNVFVGDLRSLAIPVLYQKISGKQINGRSSVIKRPAPMKTMVTLTMGQSKLARTLHNRPRLGRYVKSATWIIKSRSHYQCIVREEAQHDAQRVWSCLRYFDKLQHLSVRTEFVALKTCPDEWKRAREVEQERELRIPYERELTRLPFLKTLRSFSYLPFLSAGKQEGEHTFIHFFLSQPYVKEWRLVGHLFGDSKNICPNMLPAATTLAHLSITERTATQVELDFWSFRKRKIESETILLACTNIETLQLSALYYDALLKKMKPGGTVWPKLRSMDITELHDYTCMRIEGTLGLCPAQRFPALRSLTFSTDLPTLEDMEVAFKKPGEARFWIFQPLSSRWQWCFDHIKNEFITLASILPYEVQIGMQCEAFPAKKTPRAIRKRFARLEWNGYGQGRYGEHPHMSAEERLQYAERGWF